MDGDVMFLSLLLIRLCCFPLFIKRLLVDIIFIDN